MPKIGKTTKLIVTSMALMLSATVSADIDTNINANSYSGSGADAAVGDKTARFYAGFFMANLQSAAKNVPHLTQTQKDCVQTLPADVMLPSFQSVFDAKMTAAELQTADDVHTPDFQSAFIKVTRAARQQNTESLGLTDAEKRALVAAQSSGISDISVIIHDPSLKKASLQLFEQALEEQCEIPQRKR